MKKIFGLIVLLSLAACSNSGGGSADVIPGSELPPPTAEQKQRMGDFGQEMVDSQHGANQMQKAKQSESSKASTKLSLARTASKAAPSKAIKTSKKGYDLEAAINEGFFDGKCAETYQAPNLENGGSTGGAMIQPPSNSESMNQFMEYKIAGDLCPVNYYSSFQTSGNVVDNQTSAQANMKMEFRNEFNLTEASSPEFDDLKIRSFDQLMTVEMNMNANQNNFVMNAKGRGEMNINSTPDFEGDVAMINEITMNANGDSNGNMNLGMQFVIDYRFVDFRVVGVIRMAMNNNMNEPQMTFYVNGDQVSADEFGSLFAGIDTEATMNQTFSSANISGN